MNAATLSSPVQSPKFKKDHFGRALMIGAVIEALMIGGLIYSHLSQPVTVKPKPKIMAIHMIKPAPPKPKPLPPPPKPVVHPKPIPKPLPKPIPRPVPHPVAHHPLPPKPLLAKTPAPRAPVYTPPVTPLAPPSPPAPSPAARQSAVDLYVSEVRLLIQANLRIPEELRLMRLSGMTVVSFELTPQGRVLWAKISRSSGIGAVDRTAEKAVRSIIYPAFSRKMPKTDTLFVVDVHIKT
ncbi:TonB family protein [Acidithiobacillus ferrianus]|uniref:TonB family protein n=2 Tax=Acidithiobacillus ferrianus TaxID=2678518 RepID=A0A845UBQ2_9PROT|nr:energy transducer TonB [Acidithiobacillus ferrianus]NDU43599.1 TonB family protein [Acidithiobacillus ferrianus]